MQCNSTECDVMVCDELMRRDEMRDIAYDRILRSVPLIILELELFLLAAGTASPVPVLSVPVLSWL